MRPINDEINALTHISSPHVIKLHEKLKTQKNYYLINEFCNGGDLQYHLNLRGTLNEKEAKSVFRQVASGLLDMRSQSYCHRDIKCANLLISYPEELPLRPR